MAGKKDLVSGVGFAVLGLYVSLSSLDWTYFSTSGPGPGYFPFWYGVVMCGLALLLIGSALVAQPAAQTDFEDAPQDQDIGKVGVVTVALIGAVILVEPLGLLAASAVLSLVLARVTFRRSWVSSLTVALGNTLALYLIFEVALGFEMPTGWWG